MDNILEIIQYPFFVRALLIGSLFAIVCSFLGVYVVLRGESIIGHTIANLSFLGIALGIVLGFNLTVTSFVLTFIAAGIIAFLHSYQHLSHDSLLALLAETAMALSIILISMIKGYRVDLIQYLFGDILAITEHDIELSSIVSLVVLIIFLITQRKLLQVTFNKDLARACGTSSFLYDFIFTLILALTIAIGIKIIGILLIVSFLIIPANIAKIIATNFRQMLIISAFLGITGTLVGFFLSYSFDTPSGATIITFLSTLLLISLFVKNGFQKMKKI